MADDNAQMIRDLVDLKRKLDRRSTLTDAGAHPKLDDVKIFTIDLGEGDGDLVATEITADPTSEEKKDVIVVNLAEPSNEVTDMLASVNVINDLRKYNVAELRRISDRLSVTLSAKDRKATMVEKIWSVVESRK